MRQGGGGGGGTPHTSPSFQRTASPAMRVQRQGSPYSPIQQLQMQQQAALHQQSLREQYNEPQYHEHHNSPYSAPQDLPTTPQHSPQLFYFPSEQRNLRGFLQNTPTQCLPGDLAERLQGQTPPPIVASSQEYGLIGESGGGSGWLSPVAASPGSSAGLRAEARLRRSVASPSQSVHNAEAYRLRRLLIEEEATHTLHLLYDEALQRLIQIRVLSAELFADIWDPFQRGEENEKDEPNDFPDLSVEEQVEDALEQSSTVCADKQNTDSITSCIVSEKAASILSRWIAKEWAGKTGTILDELLDNLHAPINTSQAKLNTIKAASKLLLKRAVSNGSSDYSKLELFVMALYTMAGPDIDRLMGFKDTPREGSKAWTDYTPRNQPMFRVVNSAMRTAGTSGVLQPSKYPWKEIRQWVKSIVLLTSLASQQGRYVLSRGLAGLPQSVVDDHVSLQQGDRLIWTAPSSCALDPTVSQSYIEGTATNAVDESGGSILFKVVSTCGLPLQFISKYPKEAEVLLPPLSELRLRNVKEGDYVTLEANVQVRVGRKLRGLCTEAIAEAHKASKLLEDPQLTKQRPRYEHPLLNPTRATEGRENAMQALLEERQERDRMRRSISPKWRP